MLYSERPAPASGPAPATGSSARANEAANTALYQSVSYSNAATKGPAVIILPGEVKSNNATFSQRYGPNNIADYAKSSSRRRTSRSSIAPTWAVCSARSNWHTTWVIRRRHRPCSRRGSCKIRAGSSNLTSSGEKVAEAGSGFAGGTLGGIASTIIGGRTGSVVGQGAGSVKTTEASGVWIVGMRYKIIDARTTQQVAQDRRR